MSVQSEIDALSLRDQGRIAGAFEARGGVVISRSGSGDQHYYGIRLYIETLTINQPLHKVFGEPKVRTAYSRPVYRYEVTNRPDVAAVAGLLWGHIYDPIRRAELDAARDFCAAKNSGDTIKAADALAASRHTVSKT